MSLSKLAARRRGFTLIELLIVIVVIAILALIVIPRVIGASERAKVSTLKANLQIIRGAIGAYEADCQMAPAAGLAGLTTEPDASEVASGGTWHGPYLDKIPDNPFAGSNTGVAGWDYDPDTVKIYPLDNASITYPDGIEGSTTSL